jgi:Carboxypeptidase regulatory-like domain/TonB dependent receptor
MSIVQANVASLRPWFLKAMCFLLRKPQIAICFLRRMKIGRLLPHLLLCLLSVSPAFPQAGQGGITGLVTDSSGAVIQAAKVQARNVSTGAAFQTVTTQAGLYSFVALPPSHYDVTVTAGGFETTTHQSILVTVDQTTVVNVILRAGKTSEVVTVTEAGALVEATNSTVGQLISTEVMDRVPLLTRDEYELVQLSAGVAATNGTPNAADTPGIFNDRPGADVSAYTINGANQGTTYYSLDGSPIQVGENNLGALIPAFQVPLDGVEEFRVETQNVPATYQSGGSGVISLVSKSGGNQLHGDIFGYFRPNKFSSNDYFVKQSQLLSDQPNVAPNFHRYQEGGSLGGPIVRDKLFYFGDYEATQEGLLQTGYYTVPTPAERTGDFSADSFTVYDPLVPDLANGTRQPFPGNIIPNQDLNPISLKYAQQFPIPNVAGVGPYHINNYFASGLQPNDAQKFDVRVDYNHSAKQHIFARFSFDRNKFGNVDLYGPNNIYDPNYYQNITNGRNIIIADDYALSSTTLLQLRYSFTRHYEDQTGDPRQIGFNITTLGFPSSLVPQQVYKDIPFINFYGYGYSTTNLGSNWYTTFLMASMVHDALATLSTVKGKHNLSVGFEFQKQFMNEGQPVTPSGGYFFDNTATSSTTFAGNGSDFASFLLGMGSYPGNEYDNWTKDIFGAGASPYYAAFIQDNYRILRNLTLNLGLRWDIFGGRTERFNRLEYFDPTIPFTVNGVPLIGGEQFAGVDGHSRSPFTTNMRDFGPRLGFAYQPINPLVLRGGFAMLYGPSTQMVANSALNSDGYFAATTWNATAYNADGNTVPVNGLSNPFPSGVVQAVGSSLGPATNIGNELDTELHSQRTPVSYNYNFGFEYEFAKNFVFSAAYVGSHELYLPLVAGADQNFLPLSTIERYQSALLNSVIPDKWEAIWPITSPFYGQATVPAYLGLEPYPQFNCGAINCGVGIYAYPAGHSNYNSLQMKLQKRLTQHFTTLAAFTWSKNLTNDFTPPLGFIGQHGLETPQDWQNMNLEYTISPQDLSHTFSWQISYDLPMGPGRGLDLHGWGNKIVGGWTLNSILFLNGGIPVNAPQGTGDPYFNQRVDLACNPATPHTVAQWFSYTCFSQPPSPFFPGTAPAFLSGVRTEGGVDLDVSLFKNIRLGEHMNLQLQWSAYNVTNYVQLGYPNIFWNPSPTPANMSGFGQITNDLNTPRQFQFAGRFTF